MLGVNDLIITPLYFIIMVLLLFPYYNKLTGKKKSYFLLAFFAKSIGSIFLGIIYTYYYREGDTTAYFRYSEMLYQLMKDDFSAWMDVMNRTAHLKYESEYAAKMFVWYYDNSAFFVCKLTSFLHIISFSTYSVIALFYAFFSFLTNWKAFVYFRNLYPHLESKIAISFLFIPSYVFWGSGLLKDTLICSTLPLLIVSLHQIIIRKEISLKNFIYILISTYVLSKVKIYVIVTAAPFILIWFTFENLRFIKSKIVKYLLHFSLIVLAIFSFISSTNLITEEVTSISEEINTTNFSIYTTSVKHGGSAYYIGKLDGTLNGMFKLMIPSIIVGIFRPYLWEVRNPLMLLSAFEGSVLIYLFIKIIIVSIRYRISIFSIFKRNPLLYFFIGFTLSLGFLVGLSSSNFGTLVRYRIPFLPYFLFLLFFLNYELIKIKSSYAN